MLKTKPGEIHPFTMVELINKKRRGHALAKDEIEFIVKGYVDGQIPDYQMSALFMAICFQSMNSEETANLTMAMVESGDKIDLSAIHGVKVDKHSTGGVGDKISLIVGPLVAYLGIPVAKMSGRGLGHTGGTIDKLESIPGFRVELSGEQFISNVNSINMAIVGQTGNLAPADKKMYALRDVTATVDSIPLIASSIMSKKIAAGADGIVLDVKVGSGAFMKSKEQARELAQTMVSIGKNVGRKVVAVITDMNQPLGHEVGNANEVREAINVLKGNGPQDLNVISLTLAAHMAVLAGIHSDFNKAYKELEGILKSGKAVERFRQFVIVQGGEANVIDDWGKLPQARYHVELKAEKSGYVNEIDAQSVGIAAMSLGAGRKKKDDVIDHAAGITLLKKVGDFVEAEEPISVIHSNFEHNEHSIEILKRSFSIQDTRPAESVFIHDMIN